MTGPIPGVSRHGHELPYASESLALGLSAMPSVAETLPHGHTTTTSACVADLSHSWLALHLARENGLMDNWVRAMIAAVPPTAR
jgi:phospholipase C